jgi:hypothetical protein
MHDAMTSGTEPSLHITVGLITRTWADLMLEAVSEVALRTPALRKSLPPGYALNDFDRAAARETLRELTQVVAGEVQLDPALDLLADTFIRSRAANNRFAVRDAAKPVEPNDRFRAQPHTPYRIAEDGDKLVLIAPGGDLTFPPDRRAALDQALSGNPFTPAELGCENAEAMAARLLSYGLIARAQ